MGKGENYVPTVYRYLLPAMRVSKNEARYVVKCGKITVEGEITLKNERESFLIEDGSGISFQVPWGFVSKLVHEKSDVDVKGKCEDFHVKSSMKKGASDLFMDIWLHKSCKKVRSGDSIKFCYSFTYLS